MSAHSRSGTLSVPDGSDGMSTTTNGRPITHLFVRMDIAAYWVHWDAGTRSDMQEKARSHRNQGRKVKLIAGPDDNQWIVTKVRELNSDG